MLVDKKYRQPITGIIMGIIMSSCMSLIIVFFNVYFTTCGKVFHCLLSNFIQIWPRSYIISMVTVIPIILIVNPLVNKIMKRISME
jgi:ABC-type Mn2+/Zn2+ transport system permease subunit